MPCFAYSYSCSQPFSPEAVEHAAAHLRNTGKVFHLAFSFVTSDYIPHIEEFCDILRVEGRITDLAGCTGVGFTTEISEQESGSGFSVLAISAPEAEVSLREVRAGDVGSGTGHGMSSPFPEGFTCIPLINPFAVSAEPWMQGWNRSHPSHLTIGGLASGRTVNEIEVFSNGKICEAGVVAGFRGGGLRVRPVVSQGCRPIGEPLTVTRAENNVIYALGAQAAYQALETAFETLSDEEKSTARGNLFAGLATSEYLEDFMAGDFLIRNIIGADPNSGAVVIGGTPRIGQTLQYQYRDRFAASSDLAGSLRTASCYPRPLLASLLFRCGGRGKAFFGTENHDIGLMREILGPHPSAGLLCNGEIGPIHSIPSLTAYTAAIALFYDESRP